ncbi:elongation factor Tu domain-containing protein [Methanocaldococcus villosus KIN24-T80]|uniref:Elongation factor Tu domain-containing protein n=1 Tax=Methanocaldococcus villosus KIN24-T80 TaxID=1069083 RepID=N6VQ88_9EURY|nr:elongation factor Tu domain-containing protein [Methanocaldococcus villosus KIN24-T80]
MITVGIFGHIKDVGRELGKKGTSSDITFYNYKQGDKIVTYVEPTRYPERINPLIYTINLMDYAIVFIDEITGELGEMLLALDMFNICNGAFVLGEYVDVDMLKNIIKGTSMENFDILDKDFIKIREHVLELEIERDFSYKKIPIDHYFKVKSVGTVVLGKVEKGKIEVHDNLKLYPIYKEVMIKSIQIHDKDCKEAKAGDRVGLALKGVDVEELSRGYVLSDKELEVKKEVKFKIEMNPFINKEIKEGENYTLITGLQAVACEVLDVSNNKISLLLNKEIAYDDEKLCLIDGSAKIRILGVGEKLCQ